MRMIAALALVMAGAPALAQTGPSIPAGNPLDPGAAAAAQAQNRARVDAQQVTRASNIAAMERTRPAPSAPVDEGRPRPRTGGFGQPADDAAPTRTYSPYFRFPSGVRTPWDPR